MDSGWKLNFKRFPKLAWPQKTQGTHRLPQGTPMHPKKLHGRPCIPFWCSFFTTSGGHQAGTVSARNPLRATRAGTRLVHECPESPAGHKGGHQAGTRSARKPVWARRAGHQAGTIGARKPVRARRAEAPGFHLYVDTPYCIILAILFYTIISLHYLELF